MSVTSWLAMCHHSIIWSFMTCLKLCLALAMMPCLIIFATIFFDSDHDIYYYNYKFVSDDHLIDHPPPLDEVWLSETEWRACHGNPEECCCLADDCEWVKWIDKIPNEPSDLFLNLIEQSGSDSENSYHPPPDFVPEGEILCWSTKWRWWVYYTNQCSRVSTPQASFLLNQVILLLSVIVLELLIYTILTTLILNIYAKASKPGNTDLVVYLEPTKSLYLWT